MSACQAVSHAESGMCAIMSANHAARKGMPRAQQVVRCASCSTMHCRRVAIPGRQAGSSSLPCSITLSSGSVPWHSTSCTTALEPYHQKTVTFAKDPGAVIQVFMYRLRSTPPMYFESYCRTLSHPAVAGETKAMFSGTSSLSGRLDFRCDSIQFPFGEFVEAKHFRVLLCHVRD